VLQGHLKKQCRVNLEKQKKKENYARTEKVQAFQQDEEGDEEQHLNDEAIHAALGINEIGFILLPDCGTTRVMGLVDTGN